MSPKPFNTVTWTARSDTAKHKTSYSFPRTMKTLEIHIPGRDYAINIGTGILRQSLINAVQNFGSDLVVCVTNTTLDGLYPGLIDETLKESGMQVETCVLPDGEEYKSVETLTLVYDFLMQVKANRKTLLVAFGGGVIGDLAGFAAATFMRGIQMIQVPTTLLAHVDSSVGGKTAVNHPCGKNTIGAFLQPKHVCIDLDFLRTLPSRELKAGYFELVKHGFTHDRELFEMLREQPLEPLNLLFLVEAVFRSCAVKGRIVEQDERETGLRATLNFGHTLAHLIETHTGYTRYLHGEAVGTGMLFAAFFSRMLGFLREDEWGLIRDFLTGLLVTVVLPPLEFSHFRDLVLHDKKAERQAVNFILLDKIGSCFIREETSVEEIWQAFKAFCNDYPEFCRVDC